MSSVSTTTKTSISWFVRTFEIPVYYIDVILAIHDDFNQIDQKYKLKLKETWIEEDPNDSHAITYMHPEYHDKVEIYVMLKPKWLDIDTLSHEVAHIISFICSTKGIIIDPDNDEPLAYLQGYVSRKLGEGILSYMDKNKIDARNFLICK